MSTPMPVDGTLLYDAAVELLEGKLTGSDVDPAFPAEMVRSVTVVEFGTVIPTPCEHTHVDAVAAWAQPWN